MRGNMCMTTKNQETGRKKTGGWGPGWVYHKGGEEKEKLKYTEDEVITDSLLTAVLYCEPRTRSCWRKSRAT